jgi:hypothetical protein
MTNEKHELNNLIFHDENKEKENRQNFNMPKFTFSAGLGHLGQDLSITLVGKRVDK